MQSLTIISRFLILSVFILTSIDTIACSCSSNQGEEFCHLASPDSYIILAELIEFEDFSAGYFKVLENITDKETPDTLNILGADGWTCNVLLDIFNIGDTLVLNVSNSSSPYQNISNGNFYTWHLGACWRSYLTYSNGKVYGPMTTPEDDVLDYDDFKSNFSQCFDFTASIEEDLTDKLKVFPNPFTNNLKIELTDSKITTIEVFELSGKLVYSVNKINERNLNIDLTHFNNGLYLLNINTKDYTYRRKIIKK